LQRGQRECGDKGKQFIHGDSSFYLTTYLTTPACSDEREPAGSVPLDIQIIVFVKQKLVIIARNAIDTIYELIA
jgi:hypothetical protein